MVSEVARRYSFCIGALTIAGHFAVVPPAADAADWRNVARTELHDVLLDMDAVRTTLSGRLGLWLRFVPFGERQRRLASIEYKQKGYSHHLEYYEVDCGEDSAQMGLLDVLDKNGLSLERLHGKGEPDPIVPGSSLEYASRLVCMDPVAVDAGDLDSVSLAQEQEVSEENRRQIDEALQRTAADPGAPAGWIALGNVYYDADMPAAAIQAYSRALALSPNNPDVLNDQGAMYRQSGNIARALVNFETALALAPENLDILYNLAYINAFDLNRMDRALEVWQRYLIIDSFSERAVRVQKFTERYGASTPVQKDLSSP